jgi:imidazolonepropionase-like amidohydrolase
MTCLCEEEKPMAHEISRFQMSILLRIALLFFLWCSLSFAQESLTTVFSHVNVIPMDRDTVLHDQTVIVEGGRIVALGPSQSVKVPKGSRRVESTNLYLMPGLADMHVHFIRPATAEKMPSSAATYADENRRLALLFVANGVTSVRNMWGHPEILELNNQIQKGEIIGPTIYSVGPLTDGDPPMFGGSRVVATAEQAQQAVRDDKEAGYIGIKVYNQLSVPVYKAIVAAAADQRLPVMGHLPQGVSVADAAEAHQKSIEHFSFFAQSAMPDGSAYTNLPLAERFAHADLSKLPGIAELVAAGGTWVCPTVVQVQMDGDPKLWERERSFVPSGVVGRYNPSGKLISFPRQGPAAKPFALALVRALHEKRAGLLAGTDAYKLNIIPGFSLLEELRYFVNAGLSPYEAIKAGTSDAARFLNQENEFGTVAVGRRADLILLSANPLDDIGNVAKRNGVMLHGRWLSEQDLQRQLRQ